MYTLYDMTVIKQESLCCCDNEADGTGFSFFKSYLYIFKECLNTCFMIY